MKISNIFTLIIVSILIISCAKKRTTQEFLLREQVESIDALTELKAQTEQNNPYIINAKKELSRLLGEKDVGENNIDKNNFDHYIMQHNILKCQNNENQSACVLDFYLNEIYRLKLDKLAKKQLAEIEEIEKASHKLDRSDENIKNYCEFSADFINLIYNKTTAKSISQYQQRFKLDDNEITALIKKFEKDSYTRFLISENPTIVDEIRADNVNRCLADPQNSIINFSEIFK
ncbi:hypothetical protein PT276_03150 [Orbaceae bacterium ESL0721]|nr:hypothetical protein [Orbaceae bacterium ESL0721]